uniref:ATP synthase F0 subunit 8 n=1 Tax=Carybdea alata TaxID=1193083 RepID=G9IBZ2_CARAL|nr:ATP synthase F0 subunit 8 [Alatina alata]
MDTVTFLTQYVWLSLGLLFFLVLVSSFCYPTLVSQILTRNHIEDSSVGRSDIKLTDPSLVAKDLWK